MLINYNHYPFEGHRGVSREDEIGVEFDDGDSGRIPISQIRVLPPDYPITGSKNTYLCIDCRSYILCVFYYLFVLK